MSCVVYWHDTRMHVVAEPRASLNSINNRVKYLTNIFDDIIKYKEAATEDVCERVASQLRDIVFKLQMDLAAAEENDMRPADVDRIIASQSHATISGMSIYAANNPEYTVNQKGKGKKDRRIPSRGERESEKRARKESES
jgi:hypothetical protein